MDPERVRGYLQVACAGLGFDIGEIWWTSNESGTSTLATIEEKKDEKAVKDGQGNQKKQLRFVQLYTSKSYADRRSQLLRPDADAGDEEIAHATVTETPCSASDLEKHVLSPQLVNAISKSAQVVWANCQKQEGLLGRSDMRFQTAVGMPVAVDADGNMCIVVMFSPENLESTDDAMEYLQFISKSATSSSIPCLLPVFDSKTMKPALLPHAHNDNDEKYVLPPDPTFGEGVTAHYVSIDDTDRSSNDSVAHGDHEVTSAPKDCFGIPMLPSFAELGHSASDDAPAQPSSPIGDPFDEASFGVWATIMHDPGDEISPGGGQSSVVQKSIVPSDSQCDEGGIPRFSPVHDKPSMPIHRRERLEEFCAAFLEMSVFDASDVWMPVGAQASDTLGHVTSIVSTKMSSVLSDFTLVSQYSQVKLWSGAVGRAFASGNPVWSANYDVIADSARSTAFAKANIKTALAVPIFSSGNISPKCVVCCYSLVRAEAVPAVLRFVQQALHLLWTGLDKVEPHQSIGKDIWKDVAPADLGEMAADVEMQQTFFQKKRRRHDSISSALSTSLRDSVEIRDMRSSLSIQLQSLDFTEGSYETHSPPLSVQPVASIPYAESYSMIQSHLRDAVRSVGDAVPWSANQHWTTNSQGTKRAHVGSWSHEFSSENLELPEPPLSLSQGQGLRQPAPLRMPQALVNHLPSTGAAAFDATINSAPQMAHPCADPVQSVSGFVHYNAAPSLSTQQGQNSLQQEIVSGRPALYPSGFVQPMEFTGDGMTTQHSMITPLPSPLIVSAVPDYVQSGAEQDKWPSQATNTNGKPCRIEGCDELCAPRRPYCQRHSGNRLCEHAGCTKCAQGSTRFCISHGGGRRCTFPGCDKGARDKLFCAAHGGGKRCSYPGCSKSAVGGSLTCTSHGGGRRCAVAGCDKSAQSATKYCVKHGGGKKCSHVGCIKVARGRTQFCAAHGGGVRCKLEGCNRVAIGKLQLCRTHGGGARQRSTGSTHATTVSPPPLSATDIVGDHHNVSRLYGA